MLFRSLLENIFLYNIDDLQAIAEDYLKQRKDELARCEAIIREKAAALLGGPSGPTRSTSLCPDFSHA